MSSQYLFFPKYSCCSTNDRRNGRGRPFKATWLITPKDNWPPATKIGISMSIDSSKSNETEQSSSGRGALKWFVFEHSVNYRQLQQKFLTAVESMDSDNIIKIINQQPYHVDSLIQMSELCKMSEDHAMAAELIEHAILVCVPRFLRKRIFFFIRNVFSLKRMLSLI